jgi:hypothetical protein
MGMQAELDRLYAEQQGGLDQRALDDRYNAQQAWADADALEQFGVGVAKMPVQAYYGLKGLFTDLTDQEKAELRALDEAQSGWATAGEVAGEAAAFMVPGAALPKTLGSTVGRRVATDALVGAGMEAARERDPDTEQSISEIVASAVGAGAGSLGGEAVAKALRAAPAGREAVREGIRLSPGQARGGMTRQAENLLQIMPVTGRSVTDMQRRGFEDWGRQVLRDVSPAGAPPIGRNLPISEGLEQVQGAFTKAYGDFWGAPMVKKAIDTKKLNDTVTRRTLEAAELLPEGEASTLLRRMDYLLTQAKDGSIPAGVASKMDDLLRDAAANAPDSITRDTYKALREEMWDALPKGERDILRSIDNAYRNWKTVQKAATTPKALEEQAFTPGQLMSSAAGRQDVPMQQAARKGLEAGLEGRLPYRSGLQERIGTMAAIATAPLSAVGLPLARALYNPTTVAAGRAIAKGAGPALERAAQKGGAALGYEAQPGEEYLEEQERRLGETLRLIRQ